MLNSGTGFFWEAIAGSLELVFPRRCAACDRVDRPSLCDECRTLLEWLDPGEGCPRCGEPRSDESQCLQGPCQRCRERPPQFTQAVAALMHAGPLAKAVPLWKYGGERHLSPVLAELLLDWVSKRAPKWWESIEAVVPVPHHPRTVRVRGFVPPEELARPLAAAFSLPLLPRTLFKVRFTPPQTGLGYAARMSNLRSSTQVFDRSLVRDRILLVVDDVMTTGATLDECARALRVAGAKRVYGMVLARQSWGRGGGSRDGGAGTTRSSESELSPR